MLFICVLLLCEPNGEVIAVPLLDRSDTPPKSSQSQILQIPGLAQSQITESRIRLSNWFSCAFCQFLTKYQRFQLIHAPRHASLQPFHRPCCAGICVEFTHAACVGQPHAHVRRCLWRCAQGRHRARVCRQATWENIAELTLWKLSPPKNVHTQRRLPLGRRPRMGPPTFRTPPRWRKSARDGKKVP